MKNKTAKIGSHIEIIGFEDNRAVAAALIQKLGEVKNSLSNKKRKTAAMRRRLKDLKVLDMGDI